jgi:Na+/melibiose symporter-like transporter
MLVLYVGWSLLTLSHVSWGAELTDDYHERSRVQSMRQVALIVGLVLVLLLPTLIERMGPADLEAARIGSMGWFVIIFLPLTVALALWAVHERPVPLRPHVPMGQAFGVLLRNRPLQILLTADLITGVSGGIVASMFLFLAGDVLQLGRFSGTLLLIYFISGIVFIAPVLRLSRKLGKHRMAALAAFYTVCVIPLIWFLPPGNQGIASIGFIVLGANYAAAPFLSQSMMADVADHDTVATGQARTGLFFSLLTMTNKLGAAFAIWIAYTLLDWIGFHPGHPNDAAAIVNFKLAYIAPSVVIQLIAAILLWRFPIDEAKQRENRTILDERAALRAVATAVEVRTGEPSDPQRLGFPADA